MRKSTLITALLGFLAFGGAAYGLLGHQAPTAAPVSESGIQKLGDLDKDNMLDKDNTLDKADLLDKDDMLDKDQLLGVGVL